MGFSSEEVLSQEYLDHYYPNKQEGIAFNHSPTTEGLSKKCLCLSSSKVSCL